MSDKIFIIALILSLGMFVRAMHIHPHHITEGNYEENNERDPKSEEDHEEKIHGLSIDMIQHIRPQGLVPINNDYFFKRYHLKCEDGYERDILGVCREVW